MLHIPFPEPTRDRLRLVPFFLPFAGCPQRCVFCDQRAQTGTGTIDLEMAAQDLERLLAAQKRPYVLGLYGGTFTGLEPAVQAQFLSVAGRFRSETGLGHLRVSTRPDCLNAATARRLQELGVDMVELGVQSFDDAVLAASGRGYAGSVAVQACTVVREAGLGLGLQLLPGLPGHNPAAWRRDVELTLALEPDVVRIYPCVVVAGTELARWHDRGEYAPWPLDLAVAETGWAVRRFWERGIPVIRLGLAGEPDMLVRMQAGPWHPAFGNMVRSEVLRQILEQGIGPGRVRRLHLPRRLGGDLWGHRRTQAPALARLGITRDSVGYWDEPYIGAEMENI